MSPSPAVAAAERARAAGPAPPRPCRSGRRFDLRNAGASPHRFVPGQALTNRCAAPPLQTPTQTSDQAREPSEGKDQVKSDKTILLAKPVGKGAMTSFRALNNPFTGEHIMFSETAETTSGELVRFDWRSSPGGVISEHVHPRQE